MNICVQHINKYTNMLKYQTHTIPGIYLKNYRNLIKDIVDYIRQ
jgi:hypothetical protein